MIIKDVREFIKDDVIPYLDRWPGLLFLILASNFIFWIAIKFWIAIEYILNLNLLPNSWSDLAIVETLIFLLSFVIWFFIRRLPLFDKSEIGILIAFTGIDEATDTELRNLSKKLDATIIAEGFSGKVVIRQVSSRLIPKKEEQAHSLREKYDAKLIIWGNVDRGNIDNAPHTIFIPIFFSYGIHLSPDKFKTLHKNIGNLLRQRKWLISDRNSAMDRTYLAANIEEMSLYIVGLTLFFARDWDHAVSLLSRVLKKYKSKQNYSYDDKVAIANIMLVISEVYKPKVKNLELWPGSEKLKKSIEQANVLSRELEELEFKAPSLLTRAQVAFAEKDLPKAKSLCEEALQYAYDDPAPSFSLAFLSYYEGNLEDGFKYLDQAQKKNAFKIGDQLVSIARWYIEALNEYPQKIYLNFPLGIIYYDLIKDKILAIDHLQTFVDEYKANDSKIIRKMLYESEKRLKKNLSLIKNKIK